MDATSASSTVTQTATTAAAGSGPALFTLFKLIFIFGVLLITLYFVWRKKNPGRHFDLRTLGQQLSARVKRFLEEEDAEEEEDEPVADKSPAFKRHAYGLYLLNALDFNGHRTMIELDDANLEPGDYIQIGYTNNPGQQHKRCRQFIALEDHGCTLAKTLPENNAIVVFRDPNDNQLYLRFSRDAKVNRQEDSNGKPVIRPFNTKNDVPLTEITEYLHEAIWYVCGLPIVFSVNHRFANNDGTPNIASFSKRGESYFDMDLPENKKNPISKKKAAPVPDDDLPFVHNP